MATAVIDRFADLDDVPAGDGIWVRQNGALVWRDLNYYETPVGAQSKVDAHAGLTTSAHGGIVSASDVRLSDMRVPPDGSVTPVKLSFDPATQVELDAEATARLAHAALTTSAHGGIVASTDSRLSDTRVPTDNSVTAAKLVNGAATPIKVDPAVMSEAGPKMHKLRGWTGDPMMFERSGASPNAGVGNYEKVKIVETGTLSKVYLDIFQAGSGVQLPLNCFIGIFDLGGTRRGVSANQATTFQSTGLKPITVTADGGQVLDFVIGDFVYVGFLIGTQSTTGVAFTRQNASTTQAMMNVGLVAADGFRYGTLGSGLTALPTSIVVSSLTAVGNVFYWFGVA